MYICSFLFPNVELQNSGLAVWTPQSLVFPLPLWKRLISKGLKLSRFPQKTLEAGKKAQERASSDPL